MTTGTRNRGIPFGCPAAIAVCSMMSEMAIGKHVDDAYEITDAQVAEALGGLPDQKYHCSNLAASALQKAIMNHVLKKSAKANDVAITVLVNNSSSDGLECEHGLSFWIEFGKKFVLFDTGQTDMIQKNAERIGVNLADTDAVILSHGHYDHTGGLPVVFGSAQKANLYLHPKAIEHKFSQKAGKAKVVGMSESTREVIQTLKGKGKMVCTEQPTEVFPGFFVTGSIPRKTSFEDTGGNFFINENCTIRDELQDDQAVYFKTEKGLVILLGCAHAGVVNTLDYIVRLTGQKHIHAVIGGMHLLNASQDRIALTVEAIRKYDVQEIGLAHCTGDNAMKILKNAFSGQCFECLGGNQRKFQIRN